MDLRNRSILLTGGGSRIGRGLTRHLACRTPRLTLVARRRGPLE
jgi:short-subunit dehydrogenase